MIIEAINGKTTRLIESPIVKIEHQPNKKVKMWFYLKGDMRPMRDMQFESMRVVDNNKNVIYRFGEEI